MGDPEPTIEAPAPAAAAATPIELTREFLANDAPPAASAQILERVAVLAQELIEHGVTPHWRQALEELWDLVRNYSGGGVGEP